MSSWSTSDVTNENSSIPKLLYLIPNGGNPTGHGLTENRKRDIYRLAQKYNLLILEDDPYYYLQFKKVSTVKLFPKVEQLVACRDKKQVPTVGF